MKQAEVAQLVERQPSKLNVASSTLVFRSKLKTVDENQRFFCGVYLNYFLMNFRVELPASVLMKYNPDDNF